MKMTPAQTSPRIAQFAACLCVAMVLGCGAARAQAPDAGPTLAQTIQFIVDYADALALDKDSKYALQLDNLGNVRVLDLNQTRDFNIGSVRLDDTNGQWLKFVCIDINCIERELRGRTVRRSRVADVLLTVSNDKLYKAFLHYQKLTGGPKKSLF